MRYSRRSYHKHGHDKAVNSRVYWFQGKSRRAACLGDPAAARVQAETDRALVERMKGLKSTGRIVLELKPNAASGEALPDLVLEDGDRLLVPFRPATVNVIGSVYNSSPFISTPGQSVSD